MSAVVAQTFSRGGRAGAVRGVRAEAMCAWSSSGGARELCLEGTDTHKRVPLVFCEEEKPQGWSRCGLGAALFAGWVQTPAPARGWWVPTATTPLHQWESPTQPIPSSFLCQHLLQLPDLCFSLTKSRNCMAQPHLPQQLSCPLVPSMWGTISSSRETHLGSIQDLGTCGEDFPGQRGGLQGLCTPRQAT